MFIGNARRKLFVDEPNEWNEFVREISAALEDDQEQVDIDDVCDVLMRIYRRRASQALWQLGRE
jgi:uncharacterized protein YeaO (DUF488 family)